MKQALLRAQVENCKEDKRAVIFYFFFSFRSNSFIDVYACLFTVVSSRTTRAIDDKRRMHRKLNLRQSIGLSWREAETWEIVEFRAIHLFVNIRNGQHFLFNALTIDDVPFVIENKQRSIRSSHTAALAVQHTSHANIISMVGERTFTRYTLCFLRFSSVVVCGTSPTETLAEAIIMFSKEIIDVIG